MTHPLRNHTYRHPKMLDVDMHVLGVRADSRAYQCDVAWVSRHNGRIVAVDKVRIPREDWAQWSEVEYGEQDTTTRVLDRIPQNL